MTTDELWKTILGELELELSKATFQTFFSRTRLGSLSSGVATIICPNPLTATTIETRYYALIKDRLDRFTKQNTSLLFSVKPMSIKENKQPLPLFSPVGEGADLAILARRARLAPASTFDNFAVSGSNQLAFAAADAVAKNPGKAYNPLFLWGGTGVGKTHLIHGIGHTVLFQKPKMRVLYCTGEDFTNEIVYAIQTKTTMQFKQKYRSAELLLIDDVQFIAGKNTVQEEFFHTFNTIHHEGGQIVLTSDRPAHEITRLEDRLRSRFGGGLTIDVSPPDFELRSAILRIKAKQHGIELPMDVAQLIAANITDTRQLEGVVIRILSESQTKNQPITLEFTQTILGQTRANGEAKQNNTKPADILHAVCSYFGVKQTQLLGVKRDQNIVYPRHVLMYLLRTELGSDFMEIGSFIGGRDHSTVLHGVRKITAELSKNDKLRGDISGIKNRFVDK